MWNVSILLVSMMFSVPFSIPLKVLANDLLSPLMASLISPKFNISPQAVDCQCQSVLAPTPTSSMLDAVSINSNISFVGVPGPKMAFIPLEKSAGLSSSGIIPPPKTMTSDRPSSINNSHRVGINDCEHLIMMTGPKISHLHL